MVTIGPATVDPWAQTWPLSATRYGFQRKSFYANGRHWAFYIGMDMMEKIIGFVYSSSVDGLIWDPPTLIRPAITGEEVSVCLEEFEPMPDPQDFYVHYVYADSSPQGSMYYRRGMLNADGTVSWSAAEQLVDTADPDSYFARPTICLDLSGTPWIGYVLMSFINGQAGTPWVTHSTTSPIWTTDLPGFPNLMSPIPDANWVCIVVPFGLDIHVTYTFTSSPIWYDIWIVSGGQWYGEIDSGSIIGFDSFRISVTSHDEVYPEAVLGWPATVHIAFQDGNNDLQHISFDVTFGPSIEHLIWPGPEDRFPAISIKRYGSPDGVPPGPIPYPDCPRALFVFWVEPWSNIVFYMKSADGGVLWSDETGVATPEVWINEIADPIPDIDPITSFFEEGRKYTDEDHGYVGALWTVLQFSPDAVRYGALDYVDPDQNLLGGFFVRHATDADEDLPAGFRSGQEAEDLPGEFDVRRSNSEDLKAGFLIAQPGSENLGGSFNVRHPASSALPGKFFARPFIQKDLPAGFNVGGRAGYLPQWTTLAEYLATRP